MAVSPIHFYGLSWRAHPHGFGWDYFGVTSNVVTSIYPVHLPALQMLLGIPVTGDVPPQIRVEATELGDPENKAWVDLTLNQTPNGEETIGENRLLIPAAKDLSHLLVATSAPQLVIAKPMVIRFVAHVGTEVFEIGMVSFNFAEPPPISDDERRAIESRIGSIRAAVIHLGCKFCSDELAIGRALDPLDDLKPDLEYTPVASAPDEWKCSCGKSRFPLEYLKKSIHDLFRRAHPQNTPLTTFFARLHDARGIASIRTAFEKLIASAPSEEEVQSFISRHSVIWNFLAPLRVLLKPRVLTGKTADFGILTPGKILFLIEIEKPQTQLSTRKGGVHSDLTAAMNQIRDWRVVATDSRDALLRSLEIKPEKVDDIRFIVVAGMSRNTDPKHLTALRRERHGDVQFYTFDELAAFLFQLESQLENLPSLPESLDLP